MLKFISTKRSRLFWLGLFLLSLAFAIHVGMAPKTALLALKAHAESGFATHPVKDTLVYAPQFDSLIRLKALREATLKMAGSDSIGLIVNLRDSSVQLSIKGVIIHTTRTKFFRIDPLLSRLSGRVYSGLLSEPLKVVGEEATIVKEPIVVVQAPKDTAEASRNAYKPDTLIQNPAYLRLQLSHAITLQFDQEENPRLNDYWTGFIFSQKEWTRQMAYRIQKFVTFQKQEYQPVIYVELPVDDLRSIYRALPEKAAVVISY